MTQVETVSGVDRAWLLMDRPTNPMLIVCLIVLGSRLSRAQFRERVAQRFVAFDRFRCVPVPDGMAARWVPSSQFDIEDHVLSAALPGARGRLELEALVGELASTPLNPQRPLWTFHLVESYESGSAVIARIHHCYADGIALVQVLLSLADGFAPSPGEPADAAERNSPGNLLSELTPELLKRALHEGSNVFGKGIDYALHPSQALEAAAAALGFAGEIARLGTMPDDPPTRLKRALSGTRRVAWAEPLSLEEVKTIGAVLGCTVNDILVSTLAGALGGYLAAQGETTTGLTIHAVVPVNLREQQAGALTALGNRFGLVFVDLPIGIRHPLERLYAVHGSMRALKGSPQALITLGLLWAVGSLPTAVEDPVMAMFSAKASLVASNLPGPREPLYIAGAPVTQILFWVPQAGSIGTGISMFSYRGQVQFGVIADRELIPEPAELVDLIATEFERLVYLVLLGAGSIAH